MTQKRIIHYQKIEGDAAIITACGLCLWKNRRLRERLATAWHRVTCCNCRRAMPTPLKKAVCG